MQHADYLTFCFLKEKYFPRSTILNATVGYKPSYLCRSLLVAKDLVQEGEAWRIRNGENVCIGEDRWIGVDSPTKSRGVQQSDYHHKFVSSLIDSQHGRWKHDIFEFDNAGGQTNLEIN